MPGKNKIYFLYPPISKRERYSSEIGSAEREKIPLGLYYLAAFLRQNHFEVQVTDAEALKLDPLQIVEEIRVFAPGFVGISSTTVAFHRALEAARAIKTAIGTPPAAGIEGGHKRLPAAPTRNKPPQNRAGKPEPYHVNTGKTPLAWGAIRFYPCSMPVNKLVNTA